MDCVYTIPSGKKLRIAISGKSGCGNTTVSKMLSDRLGIEMINFTFRSLASELGVSLKEIIEKAKNDYSYDRIVDTRQVEFAMKDSCVLGSRLAIWMLEDADFRVYLTASEEVRAKRILKREGGDIEEIMAFTRMRDAEDSRRYMELYNIDNGNYSSADLIVDTSQYTPEGIVCLILEELSARRLLLRSC